MISLLLADHILPPTGLLLRSLIKEGATASLFFYPRFTGFSTSLNIMTACLKLAFLPLLGVSVLSDLIV